MSKPTGGVLGSWPALVRRYEYVTAIAISAMCAAVAFTHPNEGGMNVFVLVAMSAIWGLGAHIFYRQRFDPPTARHKVTAYVLVPLFATGVVLILAGLALQGMG